MGNNVPTSPAEVNQDTPTVIVQLIARGQYRASVLVQIENCVMGVFHIIRSLVQTWFASSAYTC
jgi:hypothetical protein